MATRVRGIRVDDDLWSAAMAVCEGKGSDVSTEVRKFLERFVARNAHKLNGTKVEEGKA